MSEYIERGALSKFVRDVRRKLPKDSKDFFTRDEMLLNFQQYVDWQPAADVEPVVRGEWERFEEQEFFTIYDGLKCSICGSKYNPESAKNYKFCPNCGAHMERSESGE